MKAGGPLLSGQWIVRYDENRFDFRTVLSILAETDWPAVLTDGEHHSVRLWIGDDDRSRFFRRGRTFFLRLSTASPGSWKRERFTPPVDAAPLWEGPEGGVALLSPRRGGDPRWRTVDLPPAFLYLGSALRHAGWPVSVGAWDLESRTETGGPVDAVRGISVYEGLLPWLSESLHRMRERYSGLIAVGGPFVTLAPLAAVYQLPPANLFVRGEGERAFPGLLRALFAGDFGQVNRINDFRGLELTTDLLPPDRSGHGLELNLTRGCRRSCLFCSHVHGRSLRRLPLVKVDRQLAGQRRRLDERGWRGEEANSVNLCDDDILQLPAYARRVFRLIRSRGLRIWGVQTSPVSLFCGPAPDRKLLDMVADPDLYVGGQPLLWLGSDAFHSARLKRLAKGACLPERLETLVADLERRRVRNFHYWISSDGETEWEEFIAEFGWLARIARTYSHFGLLAHAPFLIPYASTPIYRKLIDSGRRDQIRFRAWPSTAVPAAFDYPLVDRVETPHPSLNRLLANQAPDRGPGFFDHLKARDFSAAGRLAYHYLRQERLQAGPEFSSRLGPAQERLESILGNLF